MVLSIAYFGTEVNSMYNKKKQRLFAIIGLILAGCMLITTFLSYFL